MHINAVTASRQPEIIFFDLPLGPLRSIFLANKVCGPWSTRNSSRLKNLRLLLPHILIYAQYACVFKHQKKSTSTFHTKLSVKIVSASFAAISREPGASKLIINFTFLIISRNRHLQKFSPP